MSARDPGVDKDGEVVEPEHPFQTDAMPVGAPRRRHRYAARLNSFRRRADGRDAAPLIIGLLRVVRRIPGLTAVEVNYPQHLRGISEAEFAAALTESGLTLTALSLRFDDLEFAHGAFTSHHADVRERAIRLAIEAVELASRLGVPHVNLWMAHDGYDYPFEADYARLWADEVDGFRRVAAHNPAIRVSVEYKPLEPRRNALIRSMGEALLAAREVGLPNFGVQIDVCHSLMAREQPAAAASMALREGRLFGVHLNDGYGPADDGLLVGSVHLWHLLELLWYLRRYDYRGTIYFDTFPERVDPVAECVMNIELIERLERILDRLEAAGLQSLQDNRDTLAITRLVHQVAIGGGDA